MMTGDCWLFVQVTEGQRADANDDASQGTKEALQSSQTEETQCLGVPEELSKVFKQM